jgi:chromosome segregation ATPase
MSNDTVRSELAELRDTVHAGFARMDRYFELSQAQYLELRSAVRGDVQGLRGEVQELRGEVRELRGEVHEMRTLLIDLTSRVDRIENRLDGLENRLDGLENQVRQFRDWVTRELADVRHELRLLRQATEQPAELRRDIDALDARVTRLEQRRDDALS